MTISNNYISNPTSQQSSGNIDTGTLIVSGSKLTTVSTQKNTNNSIYKQKEYNSKLKKEKEMEEEIKRKQLEAKLIEMEIETLDRLKKQQEEENAQKFVLPLESINE